MPLLDLLLRAFRNPIVTRNYPTEKPVLDRGHRGTPEIQPGRCDAGATCVDVCPTGAITVEKDGANTVWQLDYGLCVFCGHCVEVCPNQAIIATGIFELAARSREDVIVSHEVRRE